MLATEAMSGRTGHTIKSEEEMAAVVVADSNEPSRLPPPWRFQLVTRVAFRARGRAWFPALAGTD